MNKLTPERLAEIKARAEAAQGLWGSVQNIIDFTSHARTDIPDLIAEVERLGAENTRLRAGLEAAKYDLGCAGLCENCKHVYNDECSLVCGDSDSPYRWEWRGLCAENGGRDERD